MMSTASQQGLNPVSLSTLEASLSYAPRFVPTHPLSCAPQVQAYPSPVLCFLGSGLPIPFPGLLTYSWLSHFCVRDAIGGRSGARPGSRSGPIPWNFHGASPSGSPLAWHSCIAPLDTGGHTTETDRQTSEAMRALVISPHSKGPVQT